MFERIARVLLATPLNKGPINKDSDHIKPHLTLARVCLPLIVKALSIKNSAFINVGR